MNFRRTIAFQISFEIKHVNSYKTLMKKKIFQALKVYFRARNSFRTQCDKKKRKCDYRWHFALTNG